MSDLELLLTERACQRLQILYAQHVDSGNAARVGELFTEDGSFVIVGGRPVVGRDAVTASFRKRQEQDRQSRHLITNQWIDVTDPNHASGICYWTVYNADGWTDDLPMPLTTPMAIGHYEDEFQLTLDGWRIASRTLRTVFHRDAHPKEDSQR